MTTAEIKAKVEEIAAKITSSKSTLEKFKADPTSTVKSFLPSNITQDIIAKIVEAVKAKIGLNDISSTVSTLTGLFKK